MEKLKINETKELKGASANKTVTRLEGGFLFKCYETEQKINFIKSHFVSVEAYQTLKQFVNYSIAKMN